jgi:antitoxin PrlF
MLQYCYTAFMQEVTTLTERGALTLPASIRKELGIKGKQQFLVSTTKKGEIMLRPAVTVPIEIYTETRIAEFASADEAVGRKLDAFFAKKPHSKSTKKPR